MLSTSLMGQSGPWSCWAGFGNIGAAMSGLQIWWAVSAKTRLAHTVRIPRFCRFSPRGAARAAGRAGGSAQIRQGSSLDISQSEAGMQFIAQALRWLRPRISPVALGNSGSAGRPE
ncbi:MAG: hypothetical protein R3D81_16570 [Thalassovita sp.]